MDLRYISIGSLSIIWLYSLLFCVNQTCCQDQLSHIDNDQSDTYKVQQEDQGGIDYGEGYSFREYEIKVIEPVTCYTCHLSKTSDHQQGMPNCDEPFSKVGIPTIECKGSCAITKTTLGDGDHMIVRSCLKNCKDMADLYSSVKCCSGSKCNGRETGTMLAVTGIGAGSLVLTMGMICMLCNNKR